MTALGFRSKIEKNLGGVAVQGEIFEKLPGVLLPWYEENRRELPWRQDTEPYHIWLSEIMLQQTRVEAVKGYYARFLQRLPTVEALSKADGEVLTKLWEGLGYYSRVRNLKKAAQVIMNTCGGVFPREYDKVLALPGIGPYTAGAICSIAFGQATPAVDGNVLRVVSRLTDDDTPIDLPATQAAARQALARVYPREAGAFTQALLELGATGGGPNRHPEGQRCHCRDVGLGYARGRAEGLPVKRPKARRRQETLTVFVLSCNGRYALQKRGKQGLLAGLWQFPNVPGKLEPAAALGAVEDMGLKPMEITRQVEKKHIFTHVEWDMRGVYMEVKETGGDLVWLRPGELHEQVALPTAFRIFWDMWDMRAPEKRT